MLSAMDSSSGEATALVNCLEAGTQALMQEYDGTYGGFGRAPKFSTPHKMMYLLRHRSAETDRAALHSLKEMSLGGIYDHVGYGIHRYSTDEKWLVPHFEKMLYDQACWRCSKDLKRRGIRFWSVVFVKY